MSTFVVHQALRRGCRACRRLAVRGLAANAPPTSQRLAIVNTTAPASSRHFQTSSWRLQSPDACDVHAAETENAAANHYLGVSYNATKTKKYSAELKLQDGRVVEGGDYWTAECAAKAYDSLVDKHAGQDAPRNFAVESGEAA